MNGHLDDFCTVTAEFLELTFGNWPKNSGEKCGPYLLQTFLGGMYSL